MEEYILAWANSKEVQDGIKRRKEEIERLAAEKANKAKEVTA